MPTAIQSDAARFRSKSLSTIPSGCTKSNGTVIARFRFIENGKVRMVSRNQNDLPAAFPELRDLPKLMKAKTAILDGEVVVLDEQGRPSFSLMQQRTGIAPRRSARRCESRYCRSFITYSICIYLDGYDLRRVGLERAQAGALADNLFQANWSATPIIFRPRAGALRGGEKTRAGGHSRQEAAQLLRRAAQPRMAENQNYADC